MKKAFLVMLVLSPIFSANFAFCESKGSSLEKQLFDKGNELYKVSRDLAALKEDLVAEYAETPSTSQLHKIKMAVQKMALSRRVSFLTSLGIRDISIIPDELKDDWCRGQKTAIDTSIKWTENDFKAINSLQGSIKNEKASMIMKKGAEQMHAAIVTYRQCSELLSKIMEQKKPIKNPKP